MDLADTDGRDARPARRRGPAHRFCCALLAMVCLAVPAACVGTPDPAGSGSGGISIATGGTQGVYYRYGQALAAELSRRDPDSRVQVIPTTGSVQNLRMVEAGDATCAFVAGDAAAEAAAGGLPFDRPAELVAVARIYDDYLHLVTLRSSGIESLADLDGRRVSIGPAESGTRLMVDRIMTAGGSRGVVSYDLGINESIAALAGGEIDAFFWSGGVPTGGVEDLAARVPIRLVPLDSTVGALRLSHGSVYRSAVIPQGVYGSSKGVGTLAVPNELVCRAGTPAAVTTALVDALFTGRERIARTVPQALALDRRAAIETGPVPLDPAVARWFRDTKA